jgi:hypothetical protein
VTFEQVPNTTRMTSITEHDGTLWAGGFYAPGTDGLATSTNGGDAFDKVLAYTDVKDPVACDATSNTTVMCKMLWSDWLREQFGIIDAGTPPLMPDAGVDAGTTHAAPDAGATSATDAGEKTKRTSGCTLMRPSPAPPGRFALLGSITIASLILWRRRASARTVSDSGRPSRRVAARAG